MVLPKTAILVPLQVVAAMGLGAALLTLTGRPVYWREWSLAGSLAVGSGMLSLLPLWLSGDRSVAAVSQSALMATVVHLLSMAALAGLTALAGWAAHAAAFVWWLLVFYWSSLVALVIVLVAAIRRAEASRAAARHDKLVPGEAP
jgi:hypothetical protein